MEPEMAGPAPTYEERLSVSKELEALRRMVEALDTLDTAAQIRAFRYLMSRYAIPNWIRG
jgi:hypothetical protein